MNALDPQCYEVSPSALWTGRQTKTKEYWYQHVQLIDANDGLDSNLDFGLIGYNCEEGVRRNQGRVGAKDGPDAIRQQLSRTAFHHDASVGDLGNLICNDDAMERTQDQLAFLVSESLNQSIFPIVLGGGHDVALGTFRGVAESDQAKGKRIGILNFDAHFDLRPVVDKGNSGTPFNQIFSSFGERVTYLVLGIQPAANTASLFQIADQNNVTYHTARNCTMQHISDVKQAIVDFAASVDLIYITIDMDGFSSAYAPGVSAPSPMGMEPIFVQACLDILKATNKVIALDIAELNPKYDRDNCTAKLAARLVDSWV